MSELRATAPSPAGSGELVWSDLSRAERAELESSMRVIRFGNSYTRSSDHSSIDVGDPMGRLRPIRTTVHHWPFKTIADVECATAEWVDWSQPKASVEGRVRA